MCNTVLHAWVCQKSERIFLSYVHSEVIPSHAMSFHSSMISPPVASVMDMSMTCMLHDACMMHHHMTSHELIPTSIIHHSASISSHMFTHTPHIHISLESKMSLSSSGSVNFKREYLDEEASYAPQIWTGERGPCALSFWVAA